MTGPIARPAAILAKGNRSGENTNRYENKKQTALEAVLL
jgi:hypothetical protein